MIPCSAKGISAGRFVDLPLAYSLEAARKPDATWKLSGRIVLNALAASTACMVTDW